MTLPDRPESHGTEAALARDPLRLAAARVAAEYVSRAATWARDVDVELVLDLERVHQRIVDDIQDILGQGDGAESPSPLRGGQGGVSRGY
jgi:hypothetical protein